MEFRRWGVGESTDEILDGGWEWWFKEIMKASLFALFVALLMVGCGGEAKKPAEDMTESNQSSAKKPPAKSLQVAKIDLDDKETRDKIIAEAIERDKLQKQGTKGEELYAPNDQAAYTGWVKLMYPNGQIMILGQIKNGKQDGLVTKWYENGQKRQEENYKDYILMSAVGWKPNGEKCPVTNVKDGNGVWVWYKEDGTESFRKTYKNGKIVEELTPSP